MDFSKIKTWTINGKEVKTLEVNGQVYWKKEEVPTINYFYVEDASGSDNSLTLKKTGSAPDIKLEYSTDKKQWQEWANCQSSALPIGANSKVYLRGTNNVFGTSISDFNMVNCTGNFNIGGDITTLLDPKGNILDLTGREFVFIGLFYYSKVVDASKLILPSTILSTRCYQNILNNCRSLQTAPVLPATTLAPSCYLYMFYNSINLKSIEVGATSWNEANAQGWVTGVSATGTFTKPKELVVGDGTNGTIPSGVDGIPTGWEVVDIEPPVECKAFYVEDASGSDNSLTLTKIGSDAPDIKLEYSTDGTQWQEWVNCQSSALPIAPNSKVYLRGTNNVFGNGLEQYNAFNCTKNYNVGGDFTTLVEPKGNVQKLISKFYGLFRDSKTLINSNKLQLPNTTFDSCYGNMFTNCTSLVTAPELPAKTLANFCYFGMFRNCCSLVNAPELPATTLANYCYGYMFQGCTKLNSIKVSATTWNSEYTKSWLEGVSKTGTFTKPKGTNIPIGTSGIPEGWTVVDV